MLNRRLVENISGSSARFARAARLAGSFAGVARFAVPCVAVLTLFALAMPTVEDFHSTHTRAIDAFTAVPETDGFTVPLQNYVPKSGAAPFEVRVGGFKQSHVLAPARFEPVAGFVTAVAWRASAQPASTRSEADDVPNPTAEQRNIARFVASKYQLTVDDVQRFVEHAYQAAREFRLDPYLVLAVVSVESSFNPNARSAKGAQGLMQVLTRVHTDKFAPFGGATAAFDPMANLTVGSRILKEYIVREGSVQAALKSYVGAATLSHDYGYGNKVLLEREQIAAAAGGKSNAEAPASASLQPQPQAPSVTGTSARPVEAAPASRAETAQAQAARLETARLDAERSERALAKAAQIDAALAETARSEAAIAKAAEIEAARASAARADAAQAQATDSQHTARADEVQPKATHLDRPATTGHQQPAAGVSGAPTSGSAEISVALRALSGEIVVGTQSVADLSGL